VEQRGLVLHIAEGSFEGTIAWQRNPAAQVSSHFVVAKDGRIAQVVDTAVTAWTQQAGNGHWVSVENEGFTPGALTAAQIEANAQILARGRREHGWPLQLAASPAGLGLGHHSMGTAGRSVPTDTWTGATWGHESCPGPAIIGQKSAILARAIAIVNGNQEDDMSLTPEQASAISFETEDAWRTDAMFYNLPATRGGAYVGKPEGVNQMHAVFAQILADLDALQAAVAEIGARAPGVLTEADLLAVQNAAQAGARAGIDGTTAVFRSP
jgi:hypothetical protein